MKLSSHWISTGQDTGLLPERKTTPPVFGVSILQTTPISAGLFSPVMLNHWVLLRCPREYLQSPRQLDQTPLTILLHSSSQGLKIRPSRNGISPAPLNRRVKRVVLGPSSLARLTKKTSTPLMFTTRANFSPPHLKTKLSKFGRWRRVKFRASCVVTGVVSGQFSSLLSICRRFKARMDLLLERALSSLAVVTRPSSYGILPAILV